MIIFSRFLKCLLISGLFAAFPALAYANNVSAENAELVERDADADTIKIEFDISWSNSWYDSINKDAVWVFAKYCVSGCTPAGSNNPVWSHVKLASAGTNPENFSTGTKQASSNIGRIEIIVPADKTGAFIQPAQQGSGTLDFHDVQLVWDYGANGVSDSEAIASTMRIRVFAVEMVYIPEGGFYAGDGTSAASFEYGDGSQNIPPAINSEAGISFRANSPDAWYYNSAGDAAEAANGAQFDVSEAFPKGFRAFYLMKYELSQGQYRDFINLLTKTRQFYLVDLRTDRFVLSGFSSLFKRNGLRAPTTIGSGTVVVGCDLDSDKTFDESVDGEWIAANFLGWARVAAYADWAALRPITELEFEKAARGPLYPVAGEYAWGTTAITAGTTLANGGTNSETVTQSGNGLSNYNNSASGPHRGGFASTASTTTRAAAGAGYYGNLDLSGNAAELTVAISSADGRGFSGTHGDGELGTYGANNIGWPGYDTALETNASGNTGTGERGGSYVSSTSSELRISDRSNNVGYSSEGVGGRLARTSPEYD